MSIALGNNIQTAAASVGLVVDRSVDGNVSLGNVWVIDQDKVATCAHLVYGFRNFLPALKVDFPQSKKEYGIESLMFHPRFDLKTASKMAQVALTEPVPSFPLQLNNAVVLKLTENVPKLTDDMTIRVNRNLSLPAPPREQGLGGNLGEIDLYVVIQTITNARKEGILTICDDRNYPVARIFCQDGRIMYAHFRNLVNEMALYQIVNKDLKGNFFFWGANKPNWTVSRAITRPTDMVLIESHRRFDELKRLINNVGSPASLVMRLREQPNLDILPPELKDYASMIWSLLDGGVPIGQLWQLTGLDDFAIYSTVSQLISTQQAQVIGDAATGSLGNPVIAPPVLVPLDIAVNATLAPWDSVTNLNRDYETGGALARSGSLLGLLREGDPWHMMHNIRLVPEAAGSPIFKDGRVIGMHCGALASDVAIGQQQQGSFQGMLWVDAVIECLKGGGESALATRLTLVDLPTESNAVEEQQAPPKPLGGCKEVASIDCPRCGRSSLESARFCKSCGQQLFQDTSIFMQMRETATGMNALSPRIEKPVIPFIVGLVIMVGIGAAIYFFSMHGIDTSRMHVMDVEPVLVDDGTAESDSKVEPAVEEKAPEGVEAAKSEWVDVQVFKQVLDPRGQSSKHLLWKLQSRNEELVEGDLIYLQFSVKSGSYVYVLYNGSSEPDGTASLIFPIEDVDNKELAVNDSFTIPANVQEQIDDSLASHIGLEINPPAGEEKLVIFASKSRLSLPGNSELINRVFRQAQSYLGEDAAAGAKLVKASEFPPEIFVDGESTKRDSSIYIGRYVIRHIEKPEELTNDNLEKDHL